MYSTEFKLNRKAPPLKEFIKHDLGLLVGSNIERECNKCKMQYMPNKNDISTKRPSTYYKTCFNCRIKLYEYNSKRNSNT